MVIPVFNEAATLLDTLAGLTTDTGSILVVLVLNRPATCTDPDANTPLRLALQQLPEHQTLASGCHLATIAPHITAAWIDLETATGVTPAEKGVGLARKTGCDLALQWIAGGAIDTQWICSSDADALLPADYFARLADNTQDSAALLFPFIHQLSGDAVNDEACLRYELRLHHYVLGLQYAGSPYAFHTLGSCLAVRASNYAQVRGFPVRSAAEDFYLLNKLAKTGEITQKTGQCIELSSRPSTRVPFGTGPAIQRLIASKQMAQAELYYDPRCFDSLRAVLLAVETLYDDDLAMTRQLQANGLALSEAELCASLLETMGIGSALAHCRRQAGDLATYTRHFHQWFDGFRTLKFIHGLRDAEWSDLSAAALADRHEDFWPGRVRPEQLLDCRAAILDYWQWFSDDPERC